jgi:hypothetical protein
MQITLQVTDEIRREAESRGLPVIDFVETLIARGLAATPDSGAVSSAIQRIRALRSSQPVPKL